METKNYTYFVLTRPSLASWSFNSYTDQDGNSRYIQNGKDKNGEPIMRRFKFSSAQRTIRVPNGQEAIIDFLRNSPNCKGSPNGNYGQVDPKSGEKVQYNVFYKEMAEGKDAKISVDAYKNKLAAENRVLALETDDLRDAANMIGEFRDDESLQMHSLLQFASQNPDRILSMLNSDDFKARALIRRATKAGVVQVKGGIHYHKDVMIGVDEDEAVGTIIKNNARKRSILNSMDNQGS